MASKPETNFTRSVHKHLSKTYVEKMANPYRGGTPDVWYSGHLGDLWVEYKYLQKLPRTAEIRPDLSPLQILWLRRRHADGRNVAVVVGCPEGAVVYRDLDWEQGLRPEEFRTRLITRPALAEWIVSQVGYASEHRTGAIENLPRGFVCV